MTVLEFVFGCAVGIFGSLGLAYLLACWDSHRWLQFKEWWR